MILRFVPSLRSDIADLIIATFDAGAGPVTAEFYTGAIPTNLSDAITTQVKLGTLTCSDPVATQTLGEITFSTITQDNAADASGQAAWVGLRNGAGTLVALGDVTDLAGNGFAKVNTTAFVEGGPIAMTSLTITVGGA